MARTSLGLVAVLLTMLTGCGGGSPAPDPPAPEAGQRAAKFLSDYVTEDGQVLRTDQGGDTVSEGQAYGMLLAEVAGEDETAREIWRWSQEHLQRDDALLAYHANGAGQIIDANPASDADALMAYALLRYDGDGASELHRAGRQLAAAVLEHETVTVDGAPVLVAGTWALGPPAVVNPSYWMPGVFSALAHYTGDDRWQSAADHATALVRQVTEDGRLLPPDWASLQGSHLTATGAPDGSAPVRYGLDAERLPVWLATSCTADARDIAARWWGLLGEGGRGTSTALSLSGGTLDDTVSPVAAVAAAAAASAAGVESRARSLLDEAATVAERTPTYYGDAWLALGGALLDGSLAACEED